MSNCPVCGKPMMFWEKNQKWWCKTCKQYRQTQPVMQPAQQAVQQSAGQVAAHQAVNAALTGIWAQNNYKIRKKVLALTNQYWIQDSQERTLGYAKQKAFKLKEDIRIFTDETMKTELFKIKQQEILDIWMTCAVTDSRTNQVLGYVKRKVLSSMWARSEWEIFDRFKNLIGGIYENKTSGAIRRWMPGGSLVPIKTQLTLNNYPVADINQQFKMVGDVWDINCIQVPPYFDRRVLLACALLMGMIERQQR